MQLSWARRLRRSRSFLARSDSFRPRIEVLEDRRMLACQFDDGNGTLLVLGDDDSNHIAIVESELGIQVTCDGLQETFRGIDAVQVDAKGGDDILDVATGLAAKQSPLTIEIVGGDGLDSVGYLRFTLFLPDGTPVRSTANLDIPEAPPLEESHRRHTVSVGPVAGDPDVVLHSTDAERLVLDLGAGDDTYNIDSRAGLVPAIEIEDDEGNDGLFARFQKLHGEAIVAAKLGGGDDLVDLSVETSGDLDVAIDTGSGDDTVLARVINPEPAGGGEDPEPPSETSRRVSASLRTGDGRDQVKTNFDELPDLLHVDAGLGNDDISVLFVGSPGLPDPNEPSPVIDIDVGAGVDGLLLDVYGSPQSPPVDVAAADITPSTTLTEVLASIFISGVGLMSLLTLFPLGALEMAQSIQDDRAGHLKESNISAAIVLNGADLSVDLTTGAAADAIRLDLEPVAESDVLIDLATGVGGDRIDVRSKSHEGPLSLSLEIEPGTTAALPEVDDEVLVSFEHGDIHQPIVLGALWNSPTKPAERAASGKLSLQAAADSLGLAVDLDVQGARGPDSVDVRSESAAGNLQQKVRIETGDSADGVTVLLRRLANPHLPADPPVPAVGQDELEVITGGGNDTIHVELESAAAAVAQKVRIDSGTGDDRVAAQVPQASRDGLADLVVGADAGAGPHVKVFDSSTGAVAQSFLAYAASFSGGVRVATGDVTGDGVAEVITGAGPGAGPHVKVFDGRSGVELRSFLAYDPAFSGGVYVAAGDVNGDGRADIVTGADASQQAAGGHVKVFDGSTGALIRSFFAFTPNFTGGVRVAAGDVNNDGLDDIIVGAGPGGGPHVKIFDGRTSGELASFDAYDPSFSGGVFVAAGDLDGDGKADIVTGADAGVPGGHVKVFSGNSLAELRSFFAYGTDFTGGVRVAAGDVNGDGLADIVTGAGTGAGGGHVKVFDAQTNAELKSFFAFDPSFSGGVFVTAGDLNSSAVVNSLDLDLAIETGTGNDAVNASLSALADELFQKVRIGTGDGRDSVELALLPYLEQDNFYQLLADLGPDNDRAHYWVYGTELPGAAAEQPSSPGRLELKVLGGLGNDTISGRIGSDRAGQLLPLALGQALFEIDGGTGNDRISLEFADTIFAEESLESIVHGGAGKDRILVRFDLGQASAGVLSVEVHGDAGNDDLGLSILPEQFDDVFALLDGGKGRDRCRVTANVTVTNCER